MTIMKSTLYKLVDANLHRYSVSVYLHYICSYYDAASADKSTGSSARSLTDASLGSWHKGSSAVFARTTPSSNSTLLHSMQPCHEQLTDCQAAQDVAASGRSHNVERTWRQCRDKWKGSVEWSEKY